MIAAMSTRRPAGTPVRAVVALVARGEPAPAGLEELAQIAELRVADDAASLAAALNGADVLFVWDFRTQLLAQALPHAGSLRWIQTASIGSDAVPLAEAGASGVVVTNTRGVFERPVAEYVLTLILAFAKDLPTTLAHQRERHWSHRQTEGLSGRRVLVLGAGGIARELVPMLRAVGTEVTVVGRSARPDDGTLGPVLASSSADELLPAAEFVVLALPLTPETRGYLDARRLSLLDSRARIINVGRGGLIDEPALVAALRSGAVAGAALDVFAQEPLPPDHPFWTLEQVLVSPHMSGDLIGWERAVVAAFAENLHRWQAGEPLYGVIDHSTETRTPPDGPTW
jgi:phosphoglycerate dehydrogenase-like enzyme